MASVLATTEVPGRVCPEARPSPLTCVVADDHPAVLRALCDYLTEEEIEVVARASQGEEALAKILACAPDVALVDLRMPGLGGIEIARRLARASAGTAVVLYTGFGDGALLSEALDAGARGLVLKDAPLGDLLRALTMVAQGHTYVDPALAGVLVDGAEEPKLTHREREVLRLLADGLSHEQIARQLFLSAETIRTHVQKAMRKLGAETRTEAVAIALRRGLIA